MKRQLCYFYELFYLSQVNATWISTKESLTYRFFPHFSVIWTLLDNWLIENDISYEQKQKKATSFYIKTQGNKETSKKKELHMRCGSLHIVPVSGF